MLVFPKTLRRSEIVADDSLSGVKTILLFFIFYLYFNLNCRKQTLLCNRARLDPSLFLWHLYYMAMSLFKAKSKTYHAHSVNYIRMLQPFRQYVYQMKEVWGNLLIFNHYDFVSDTWGFMYMQTQAIPRSPPLHIYWHISVFY